MFQIEYTLKGHGWATCIVKDSEKSIKITASYLSNPIRNLLCAIIQLINGDKKTYASFDEEPGEYRWIFSQLDDDNISITILEFDELWGKGPDEKGKKIFETTATLKDTAYTIYLMAEKILKEIGEEKYKELWGHTNNDGSFPLKEFNKVHEWLKSNTEQPFKGLKLFSKFKNR